MSVIPKAIYTFKLCAGKNIKPGPGPEVLLLMLFVKNYPGSQFEISIQRSGEDSFGQDN